MHPCMDQSSFFIRTHLPNRTLFQIKSISKGARYYGENKQWPLYEPFYFVRSPYFSN